MSAFGSQCHWFSNRLWTQDKSVIFQAVGRFFISYLDNPQFPYISITFIFLKEMGKSGSFIFEPFLLTNIILWHELEVLNQICFIFSEYLLRTLRVVLAGNVEDPSSPKCLSVSDTDCKNTDNIVRIGRHPPHGRNWRPHWAHSYRSDMVNCDRTHSRPASAAWNITEICQTRSEYDRQTWYERLNLPFICGVYKKVSFIFN